VKERSIHMSHKNGLVLTVTALAVALPAATASAATRTAVHITDTRTFAGASSVTTDLAECPTATTTDLRVHVADVPDGGIFFGLRDFQCSDDSGFVVRLTARFGAEGSTGTWSIVDAYGDLEGLHGSGTLEGVPIDEDGDGEAEGIQDFYTGTVTWS
jgi:hypothetical protein